MTTNTDSLLSDFARSNDRHREAARKTIAPKPDTLVPPRQPASPSAAVIDRTEKMKEATS